MNELNSLGFLMGFFENLPIKCYQKTKNHKFLFFRWQSYGYHDLHVVNVSKWGHTDVHLYEVWVRCKTCGANFNQVGIDEATVLTLGVKLPK